MIIGLGYKARCGKDTAADYLVEHHGYQKQAFAGTLKEACKVIFHLSDEQVHGELKGVLDPFWKTTPRDILQRVGTEAMRVGFDQDIWVNSLKRGIQGLENVVVSDVRFPNEAQAIKDMGGAVVLVQRQERDKIDGQGHASEVSMEGYEDWDYVLDNNGDLAELYAKVEVMLQELG